MKFKETTIHFIYFHGEGGVCVKSKIVFFKFHQQIFLESLRKQMTQVNSYKDIPSKSSCQLEKINGHDR